MLKGIFRRAVPVLLVCLVLLVGGAAVTGAAVVLSRTGDDAKPAPGRPGATASPGSGAPSNVVPTGAVVAPLRRVVPPDVMAVVPTGITPAGLAKVRGIGHVRDVTTVAGGSVRLKPAASGKSGQETQANVFGVDPSAFRPWTTPDTAADNTLWQALAKDEFVGSQDAAQRLGLRAGTPYPMVGRSTQFVRLAKSAPLGLPGVDALVSRRIADRLGLVRDVAVLVNAPGVDPGKLTKKVRKALGKASQVLNLDGGDTGATPSNGKPRSYLDLYKQAASTCKGLSWTVLAAIGQVESDHGRNAGRSSAGALGPMQFLPSTWRAYGVDGDHDGRADIMNPFDAVPAAAKYLCANGAGGGGKSLYKAIFQYNHADWYVRNVLSLAGAYARRFN
ncbi:MAG TPA: lytic transglycosylase domain-containing protein [Streptosporangiaceae bacterium]|jgi:hypothetical protein